MHFWLKIFCTLAEHWDFLSLFGWWRKAEHLSKGFFYAITVCSPYCYLTKQQQEYRLFVLFTLGIIFPATAVFYQWVNALGSSLHGFLSAWQLISCKQTQSCEELCHFIRSWYHSVFYLSLSLKNTQSSNHQICTRKQHWSDIIWLGCDASLFSAPKLSG